MGADMFPEWINPLVSVGIGVFLWRYMAYKEKRAEERFDKVDERFDRYEARFDERFDRFDGRFDRMEYRIDGLAHEVAKNGRALARIEAHYEGRPLTAAE